MTEISRSLARTATVALISLILIFRLTACEKVDSSSESSHHPKSGLEHPFSKSEGSNQPSTPFESGNYEVPKTSQFQGEFAGALLPNDQSQGSGQFEDDQSFGLSGIKWAGIPIGQQSLEAVRILDTNIVISGPNLESEEGNDFLWDTARETVTKLLEEAANDGELRGDEATTLALIEAGEDPVDAFPALRALVENYDRFPPSAFPNLRLEDRFRLAELEQRFLDNIDSGNSNLARAEDLALQAEFMFGPEIATQIDFLWGDND